MKVTDTRILLLIDSDTGFLKALNPSLEAAGFTVLTAESTDFAAVHQKTQQADMVLIDINADRSADIIENCKTGHNGSRIPVIAFVADESHLGTLDEATFQADDYIVIPCSFLEVYSRIKLQLKMLALQEEKAELLERILVLQQMTLTDELTGLYNRRYVLNKLAGDISHAARYQEPITFIMIDIDHFKKVNDTYGHIAGDSLLKEIAVQINDSIRDSDIAIRFGGEEFLVVCTNTDTEGAWTVADRIRCNIKNCKVKLNGDVINVTVSLGIRSSNPEAHTDPHAEIDKSIQGADIALYQAKSNGRNRIEVYNGSRNYAGLDTPPLSLDAKNHDKQDIHWGNH